jgi:hypothetical protein
MRENLLTNTRFDRLEEKPSVWHFLQGLTDCRVSLREGFQSGRFFLMDLIRASSVREALLPVVGDGGPCRMVPSYFLASLRSLALIVAREFAFKCYRIVSASKQILLYVNQQLFWVEVPCVRPM